MSEYEITTKLLFDLDAARRQEAERRLRVLSTYAQQDFDASQLREFAQTCCIPPGVLAEWKQLLRLHGPDGLLPQDWMPLTQASREAVKERFALLEKLVDATTILPSDIDDLALRMTGSAEGARRRAERLVRRYQTGGVWGLAPERDPEKMGQKQKKRVWPDQAAASQHTLAIAEQRFKLIAPLLERKHIQNDVLQRYARRHNTSTRTLRQYIHDYRTQGGLRGLLPPEERSDKGHRHHMSERMDNLIAGLRFSQADIPLHRVHTLACQRARLLGEPEPSLWQVRQVCDGLSDEMKEIADGRYGTYRNKHRTTYRYHFDGSVIVFQIDYTPVDVLVKDKRRGIHTKSKEIRPFLILCMESSSRLTMAAMLSYDDPTSDDIALVLREALITTENKPYGGIPHAVWIDKGPQMISHHMHQIARDIQFELHACTPNFPEERGKPQQKGIVERFFKTLNQRLWSTLEGYTHSNTSERNPNVQAKYTITELANKLQDYLDTYHHTSHSETGQTPLDFWAEHCYAIPVEDHRKLDLLLLPIKTRDHIKEGIKYAGRVYWDENLAAHVPMGAEVLLRAARDYTRPDTVEVFYQKQWICTATARDSQVGRQVTGKQVLTAQRKQEQRIREDIREKRAVLQQADQEIQSQEHNPASDLPQENTLVSQPEQNVSPSQKRKQQEHVSTKPSPRSSMPSTSNAWNLITQLHDSKQRRKNA
jgi:hypothetical protein